VVLWLQCHKGYKVASPVHARPCFGRSREAARIERTAEVEVGEEISREDADFIWKEVEGLVADDVGEGGGDGEEEAGGGKGVKPEKEQEQRKQEQEQDQQEKEEQEESDAGKNE
jgi:hypothetical protein